MTEGKEDFSGREGNLLPTDLPGGRGQTREKKKKKIDKPNRHRKRKKVLEFQRGKKKKFKREITRNRGGKELEKDPCRIESAWRVLSSGKIAKKRVGEVVE